MNAEKKFFSDLKRLNLGMPFRMKDIIVTYEKLRPSCRIIIGDSKVKELEKFCENHGLAMEKSSFKIVGVNDLGKGGWSTRHVRVPPESIKGDWYCYVSNGRELAKKARDTEEKEDSEELGIALGYPECCRKLFLAKAGVFGDYVLTTLHETRGKPPYNSYNNFASQYFGFSLLSHFPCSFNCRNSAELAEKYFKALQKYSKKWAQRFIKYQKSAILFTEREGVFLIEKFSYKNGALAYDNSKIKYTTKNGLFENLEDGDNIKIFGKSHIIIRKGEKAIRELNGKDVGMMIFG